jgi:hypothetical protein
MLLLRELPDGLAIKGADLIPGISLLYKDGMVCDTDMDYCCRTCTHWEQMTNSLGPIEIGRCNALVYRTGPEFGCVKWTPKA